MPPAAQPAARRPTTAPRARRRPRAPTLTPADLVLLRFAAEQRAVIARQVARLLGVGEPAALRRLARLRDAKLVDRGRPWRDLPQAHRITAAGLRAAGSELPAPRFDYAGLRHDIGLGWLWLALRAGALGPLRELHSERELRAREGRPSAPGEIDAPERLAVRPVGVAGGGFAARAGASAHFPDVVALSAGGRRIAFELELSDKGTRRLERILAAYAGDQRYDLVVYLTDEPRIAERVRSLALGLGCEHVFRVAQVSLRGTPATGGRGAALERSPAREARSR